MKLGDFKTLPPAIDPKVTYRELTVEADCESLERMRKVARVRDYTFYCDEREPMGDGTAPSPLAYFTAGIGL